MRKTSTSIKTNLEPGPIEKVFELGRAVTEKAESEGGYGTGFLAGQSKSDDFGNASHNQLQRAQQLYWSWDLELARKADRCGLPYRNLQTLLSLEASRKERELALSDETVATNIAIRAKKRDQLLELHRSGKLRGIAFLENVRTWRKENLNLFGAGDAAKVLSDSARGLKGQCGRLKTQLKRFRQTQAATAELNGTRLIAKEKRLVAALTSTERALAHIERML